jgi:hypothetical protein
VVFDEDSFPLATSLSLTDMDFLCEFGPTVSTIGTHLTIVGTSTPAPHRPTLEIHLGFEPPVAPLPAPAVPLGFLPQAVTTAAPPAVTNGPPPRTWSTSPVTYVWREVGAGAVGTRGALGATLHREVGVGGAGTRGTPRATSCWEAIAGVTGTRGAPELPYAGGGSRRWEPEPWGHVTPLELL